MDSIYYSQTLKNTDYQEWEDWTHKEKFFCILQKQDPFELKVPWVKKTVDAIQSHLVSIIKLGTSPQLVEPKC